MTIDQTGDDTVRDSARKRLRDRRDVWTHGFVYVVCNGFLVIAWLLTGQGYFWPGWVLAAWGLGIIFQTWDYYWKWHRPITEATVDAEVRRRG